LSNETIAKVIPLLFDVTDFGLLSTDFPPSANDVKLPVGLQLRCWEAKDLDQYYTPEECGIWHARVEERKRVREECLRILEGLDDVEKVELLRGDKGEDKMSKLDKKACLVEKVIVSRKYILCAAKPGRIHLEGKTRERVARGLQILLALQGGVLPRVNDPK
jgi:hypothetical protein